MRRCWPPFACRFPVWARRLLEIELDFAWRDRLPDFGLPLPAGLEHLAALDRWSRDRLEPREWAARLKTLRTLLPSPRNDGGYRSGSNRRLAFDLRRAGGVRRNPRRRRDRARCVRPVCSGGVLEAGGNCAGARAFARAGCAAERGPRHGRLRSAAVGAPGGFRVRADRAAFPAVSSRGSDPGRRGTSPGGSGYGCGPANGRAVSIRAGDLAGDGRDHPQLSALR